MPKFWTTDKQPLPIERMFAGSAFLCLSGPSLISYNLAPLASPGYITMGVNNSPVALRKHGGFSPSFWTMTDDVKNFCQSIYLDPQIVKFLPEGKPKHRLWDNNAWKESKIRVRDCPGIVLYKRPPGLEEFFDPKTFLVDDRFCWGNHARRCACGFIRPDEKGKKKLRKCPDCGSKNRWGSRSCMLVAVRILYELGFSRIFLLGADFKMEGGRANYAFSQDRAAGAIRNNNNTYRMLNERFAALRPVFEAHNCRIYNCYKDSGLEAFDYKPYSECLEMAAVVPDEDRTEGLYDRKAREKAARKAAEREKAKSGSLPPGSPRTLLERLKMAREGKA